MLGGREDVDDTIDRFGGIGGVQSAENKVTGSGRGQRELDRFQIAHFADQNDVRIFTQCAAQRVGKGAGMDADFAMLNETILTAVYEFDRIFHRDDVVVAMEIRMVDHRGERG